MIHLNPIEYPVFNSVDIRIKSVNTDKTILEIELLTGLRIYYGKRLTFVINNVTYTGRYTCHVLEQPKYYLVLDTPCDDAEVDSIITVNQTFIVPDDNQGITFQDLQEKFLEQKVPAKVSSINGIDDIGSNNIVDGFQTLKIDDSLFAFKTAVDYELTKNSVVIGSFKINEDKLNRYQIFLYSNNIDKQLLINFEIGVAGNCETWYIKNNSHIEQSYSFENQLKQYTTPFILPNNIKLQVSRQSLDNQTYITVSIALEQEDNISVSGYISCKHPSDLWVEDDLALTTNGILNFNGVDSINIDQTLIYADKFGEQRIVAQGETQVRPIPVKSGYNITSLPVGYYSIDKNDCPFGIPGIDITDSKTQSTDLSEKNEYFKDLIWSNATLIVMQNDKYMLYTTNGNYLFIGSKYDIKDTKWYLLSTYGHTHSTDELEVGDNKFVTQEQIDTWNDTTELLGKYSWKHYLTDGQGNELTDDIDYGLLLSKGNASIKFDELGNPIIYAFDGNNIVPISIGALTVESEKVLNPETVGTLIKQSTIDRISNLGIGYRIPNRLMQFILINNDTSVYKNVSEYSLFFDLVERINNTIPGNLSINLGFLNDVALDNSVYIGTGLTSFNNLETDKIVIGKWNNPVQGAEIEFGIGEDITNRKTAFYYSSVSKLFGTDVNYYNKEFPYGYILVNGSNPIENDFVHYSEFNEVKEKVDDVTENSIFIKLIPLDETKSPVIQRVLCFSDYSEYNTYYVGIKLNGENLSEIIDQQVDEDGEIISINYKLQDKYKIYIDIIENPEIDDEDDEEESTEPESIEITEEDFEDDGSLYLNIAKASILRIVDTSASLTYEVNMLDYINNLTILQNKFILNITNSNLV